MNAHFKVFASYDIPECAQYLRLCIVFQIETLELETYPSLFGFECHNNYDSTVMAEFSPHLLLPFGLNSKVNGVSSWFVLLRLRIE